MNIQKISFRHYPLLSLLILIVLSHSCKPQAASQNDGSYENYVLLVSFDGFRWDYTDAFHTPNFDKIASIGTKAVSLKPSFPTKTFPNHYTIVTGLYPDHHGNGRKCRDSIIHNHGTRNGYW